MPINCACCVHEEAEEINRMLLTPSVVLREVAGKYGMSISAVHRHAQHLPEQLVVAHEARQVAVADRLLVHVDELRMKAEGLLEKMVTENDYRGATMAIREARGCIETLFKVAAVMQEQRWRQGDVEWWARQMVTAMRQQLGDVASGEVGPEEALERIMAESERLLQSRPSVVEV